MWLWQKLNQNQINEIMLTVLQQGLQSLVDYSQYTKSEISWSTFSVLSEDDVRKLVSKSASKSCILDPIPTHFLKTIIIDMLPVLTKIINMSLQQGSFPDVWKTAIVTPLLKKHELPLESQNYRPISNLSYVSKLIESASMEQFTDHLARYSLSYDNNSAYKKGHGTETILTKVHSDILMEMDNRNVVLLIMLDLIMAFDTVDYKTMFQILDNKFGLNNNNVINWFKSYLNNRKIQVRVANELSEPFPLDCGVPEGSCTGPLFLFDSFS